MAGSVRMVSHAPEVKAALAAAARRALEAIGGKAESYARGLVRIVDEEGKRSDLEPRLKNSIGHRVDGDRVAIGSSLEAAPFIELGTGPHYEPPPEWMENRAKGGKGRAGYQRWLYCDEASGEVRVGTPQPARPYLRPAILDHLEAYKAVIEESLKDA